MKLFNLVVLRECTRECTLLSFAERKKRALGVPSPLFEEEVEKFVTIWRM